MSSAFKQQAANISNQFDRNTKGAKWWKTNRKSNILQYL